MPSFQCKRDIHGHGDVDHADGLRVPLAAFGLVNPVWAGAAMSASSLSVIANSLRLRTKRLQND